MTDARWGAGALFDEEVVEVHKVRERVSDREDSATEEEWGEELVAARLQELHEVAAESVSVLLEEAFDVELDVAGGYQRRMKEHWKRKKSPMSDPRLAGIIKLFFRFRQK